MSPVETVDFTASPRSQPGHWHLKSFKDFFFFFLNTDESPLNICCAVFCFLRVLTHLSEVQRGEAIYPTSHSQKEPTP